MERNFQQSNQRGKEGLFGSNINEQHLSWQKLPWISLRLKLVFGAILATLLAIVPTVIVINQKATAMANHAESRLVEDLALSLRNRVNFELQQATKDIVLISALPTVLQSVELSSVNKPNPQDAAQRLSTLNMLEKAKSAYSFYDSLWIMNTDGELLVGAFTLADIYYTPPSKELLSKILEKNTITRLTPIKDILSNQLLLPVFLKIVYNGQRAIIGATIEIVKIMRQALAEIHKDNITAMLVDADGTIITTHDEQIFNTKTIANTPWFQKAKGKISGTTQEDLDGLTRNIAYHKIPQTELYAIVIAEPEHSAEYHKAISDITWLISIGAAALLIGGIWIFMYPLVRDIKNLSLFSNSIGANDDEEAPEIVIKRNDELGDLANDLTAMVSSLVDKTKQAKEATKAKSEFLAQMSHEIRTPMNAIISMTYLALQSKPSDEQKHFLNRIDRAAKNLLGILNDILNFSKLEANKMDMESHTFNLQGMLQSIYELLEVKAEEKGLDFRIHCEEDVPNLIVGDPLRLSQICINLASNAIKFTSQGCVSINISLQAKEEDSLTLLFAISDTGIGISEEAQARIFESFSQADNSITRKYEGTGLGLAISQALVKLMQGNIWVESTLGMGSTFFFTIQTTEGLPEDIQESSVPATSEIPVKLEDVSILLAEDNVVNQEIALAILADDLGAKVCIANNGAEALQLWNGLEYYDLILMDIQMPVMDGLSAARAIRESCKERSTSVPIIAITANAMSGDREKSLNAGMNDHVTKPFDILDLKKSVAYWAEESKKDAQANQKSM